MKAKRVLALLLCLVLAVGMLAACGKKETTTTDNKTTTSTEKKEEKKEDKKEDASTDASEESALPLTELPMPLVDEKGELSVWTFFGDEFRENPNETKGAQKMEELTNVHIDYRCVLSNEVAEKYGLMLAAGDYADIIYFAMVNGDRQYAGGMEKAIADGVLIDATDLIENYMPNYKGWYEMYEEAGIETLTDTGLRTLWSFSASDKGPQGENEWCGTLIRQDWLNELGLDMPVTLDDWHTVLTAFKNEKGADAPLMIGPTGTTINNAFLTAFGILNDFYQVDGQVKFGAAQPEYKEYIELMRQWYSEGLIDPNFASNNANFAPADYTATGRTGAWVSFYSMANAGMVNMGIVTDNPNFYAAAITPPVKNEGDAPYIKKIADGIVNSMIGITTSCKNPELAAMWLDYQYTNEGMMLNMYGIEGESYVIDEKGNPQFTDEILNNPEYSATDALKFWARGNGLGMYNWETAMRTYVNYEECLDVEAVWTAPSFDLCLPKNMFMTEEQANVYNSTYTAVSTYVNENTVNWITGNQTLDNWDKYVDDLYNLYDLQACIDIKQALLESYNARK